MKKSILTVIGAINIVCAGCNSYVGDTHVPQPTPQPVATQSPIHIKNQTAEDSFSIESAVNTKLRLKIIYGASEKSFSQKVAERLTDTVLLEKAELTLLDPCDAVVLLTPEFELFDCDGGYYRVKCKQVTVQIKSAQKLYASKTVEPDSLPRKLGLSNAKNQYVNPVVNALSAYLGQKLQEISNNDIAVTEMRFALKNHRQYADTTAIAKQVERISNILRSMPGIVNYTNIAQHTSQAAVTFRIVYLKDKYPQGLVNAINVKLEVK